MIEVNEEGAEAAAATVIGIATTCFRTPIKFICNNPFIYTITCLESNTVLFMGKVCNPLE